MTPFISSVNQALSLLTIAAQILIVVFLIAFLLGKNQRSKIISWLGPKAMTFSLVVALAATLGSLFYSEIAGFEPCKLCWFQRILMYPQVILLGLALWRRKKDIGDYIIALSVIGAVIAGYHYLLQRGAVPALPCSAVGYSASCSQVFVMSFGYVTIPLMAFTAFILILMLQIVIKRDHSL